LSSFCLNKYLSSFFISGQFSFLLSLKFSLTFCSNRSFSFSNFSIFSLSLLFSLSFNLSFCRGSFNSLTFSWSSFLSCLLISSYFWCLTFGSDLFNLLFCWCGLFGSRSLSFLCGNSSIINWCLFIILNSLPSLNLSKHILIMIKMMLFKIYCLSLLYIIDC